MQNKEKEKRHAQQKGLYSNSDKYWSKEKRNVILV